MRLSPVEVECPSCAGVGRVREDPFRTCPACDGCGRGWMPGAPGYGCKMTLAQRRPGEIVTLGNGDRGRILRHDKRAPATTAIGLIGEFDGVESQAPTSYPSSVGVVSVADPRWFTDDDHQQSREDISDPLQKRKVEQ